MPAVTSLQVAEAFGKRHDHVLRDIRRVITKAPLTFVAPNFGEYEAEYRTGFGMKKTPAYLLSKDDLTLVTMDYTTTDAMRIKVAYLQRFNEMEAELPGASRVFKEESPLPSSPERTAGQGGAGVPGKQGTGNAGRSVMAMMIISRFSAYML